MVKFFWYKHPKTGKIFSDQRMEGYEDRPLIKKGIKCELVPGYIPPEKKYKALGPLCIDKNREVFKADSDYVKKCKPKYIRFNDGHRELYDPTRHC